VKNLPTIIAVAYFVIVMLPTALLMAFIPFLLIADMNVVRASGFAGPDPSAYLLLISLPMGLSMLIPPFRRMYYRLPWAYAFLKIFSVNIVILVLAVSILNFGYQVQDNARHTIFFILMILAIIVGRALMCLYFRWKNVEHIGGAKR